MKKIIVVTALVMAIGGEAGIGPAEFRTPAREYGPYVWWHWMNGNVSKEGITADLEALAETGIDGATFFDASCGIPEGKVKFNTPEWFDMVRHACREANRLGLKLSMANGTGWANSGGPWVKPEDGMKFTTASETVVKGPSHFSGTLPRTEKDFGFYRDIAVVAVKGAMKEIAAEVKLEGATATAVMAEAREVAGFRYRLDYKWISNRNGKLVTEVSDDGVNFRGFEELPINVSYFNTQLNFTRRHTFAKPVKCRAMRVTVKDEANYWKISLAEFALSADQWIEDAEGKRYRAKHEFRPTEIERAVTRPVDPAETVDLTARMDAKGHLEWEVPEGEWTVIRFGYRANGQLVSGSGTKAGRGLEVDKFRADAVERHFEAYVGKLMRYLGKDGRALTGVLNDSFESGCQNWTQGFEKEFRKAKGYSIRPFLPALTGRIVKGVEETEKFLADYRDVINELFCRNYAGTMKRKANEYGLKFQLEPYGNGPFREFDYCRDCDLPMTEFWARPDTERYWLSTGPTLGYVEQVVEAADHWGHRIVGAEAFTGSAGYSRWQIYPYSLKCQCDLVYQLGVNRIYFHRFTHQPWKEPKYPGMTMGPWGMHFDRTQTWWKEAAEFVRYQTRCQYMLQQGEKVKDDVCHRRVEGVDWYFVRSTNHCASVVEKECAVTGRVPEIWYPESGETVRAAQWHEKDGRTFVKVRLETAGSAFIVFREGAGEELPVERLDTCIDEREVKGNWRISFRSPLGDGPGTVTTNALFAWNEAKERDIRYFSGSATYEIKAEIPPRGKDDRVLVDLGEVRDFATVTVNGREFRAMWKPPFAIDITDALGPGVDSVSLSVKVTNRWPNRLIGEDFLPEADRRTWTSWKHWSKRDKLLKSGLLGPVKMKVLRKGARPEKKKWMERFEEKCRLKTTKKEWELVFIGDSITENGEGVYPGTIGAKYSLLNLGYCGDTTANAVWRLENGELDGYRGKVFMVLIGTNDGGETEGTVNRIRRILDLIAEKQPQAKTLLLGLLPRGKDAADRYRVRNGKVNERIRAFADGKKVRYLDISERMLDAAGDTAWCTSDRLHPTAKGYREVVIPAVLPELEKMLK